MTDREDTRKMKMYENFDDALPAVQDVPDYAPKNFTRCEVAENKSFIEDRERK